MADRPGNVHVGIGGWDYDPWRGTFYPEGLRKADQLAFAAERLTAIEVNATFYRLQKPETFERWAAAVPGHFRFAIKASRFCTNRRVLAEAGEAVGRFCAQGFTRLGNRLGPILWQFAPTKAFDPADFAAFLDLLPAHADGIPLRHALEVRHPSFACCEFVAMAREAEAAICYAEGEEYPRIADLSADFVYARFRTSREEEMLGFSGEELDRQARLVTDWAKGRSPDELSYMSDARAPVRPRQVFAFMISGAKVRNPAAAQALIHRLGD